MSSGVESLMTSNTTPLKTTVWEASVSGTGLQSEAGTRVPAPLYS